MISISIRPFFICSFYGHPALNPDPKRYPGS